MDLRPPFHLAGDHLAIELPGARAMFTTRRGGHSTGPYTSLNLGLHTADDAATVRRNRATLADELGVDLVHVRQVHGAEVIHRDRAAGPQAPEADGQVTTTPGLAPMVLVADCLPIVLATPGAVAVLHGGWRGLAGGIVAAGVDAVRAATSPDSVITAAIGPGAGGCCYEVGEEVHAAFVGYPAEVHREGNLDLKAIARTDLDAAGVTEVHDVGLCTLCGDRELFFSHRRDGGVTGRQAGLAWLN